MNKFPVIFNIKFIRLRTLVHPIAELFGMFFEIFVKYLLKFDTIRVLVQYDNYQ